MKTEHSKPDRFLHDHTIFLWIESIQLCLPWLHFNWNTNLGWIRILFSTFFEWSLSIIYMVSSKILFKRHWNHELTETTLNCTSKKMKNKNYYYLNWRKSQIIQISHSDWHAYEFRLILSLDSHITSLLYNLNVHVWRTLMLMHNFGSKLFLINIFGNIFRKLFSSYYSFYRK